MKTDRKLTITGSHMSEEITIDTSLLLKQCRTIYKLTDDPKLSTKQQNHLVGALNILDAIYDVLIPSK